MTNNYDYGVEPLLGIPASMEKWDLRLELPLPSEYGEYVLVGCEPASIETHHQINVLDENLHPLRNVGCHFAFSTGNRPAPQARQTHWRGFDPSLLPGNFQRSTGAGYAQHTYNDGGENLMVYDIDGDGVLRLPSPIVYHCTWQDATPYWFIHTGVQLTFQRRRADVVPLANQLADIEARLDALETNVSLLLQDRSRNYQP